jgi:hypothetical protein
VGHTPFEADEPVQLLFKHMHQPVPPLRTWPAAAGVPAELEAVINRALVKNPEGRFPDALTFAAALREAVPWALAAVEVRSLVPTTAMPASLGAELARTVPVPSLEPAPSAAERSPSRDPSLSGVSRVRVQVLPANGVPISTLERAPRVESASAAPPAPIVPAETDAPARRSFASEPPALGSSLASASPSSSAGPREGTAVRLHPRMELPAIGPTQLGPAPSAVAPQPLVPAEDTGDLELPGLPRRGSRAAGTSFGTTVFTVGVSMVLAFALALGGAWAFRMFPHQRRADELQLLLSRASSALADGRYVHTRDGSDVEDLTDAVLALDPHNPRAQALRQAAAARLRASADDARLRGRPADALPHLQNALRLVEDSALRGELSALERQVQESSRPRPPRPAPAPPPAAPPPRRPPSASPLVHPPQPAQPLQPHGPAPNQPAAVRPAATAPERTPGTVLQNPPTLAPNVLPGLYNPAFERPSGRAGMF